MVGTTHVNSNLINVVSGEIAITSQKTYVELGKKPKAVIAYRNDGNLKINWSWHENMGDNYVYGANDSLKTMIYGEDFEAHSSSPEMTITETGFGLSYPYYTTGTSTYCYYVIY